MNADVKKSGDESLKQEITRTEKTDDDEILSMITRHARRRKIIDDGSLQHTTNTLAEYSTMEAHNGNDYTSDYMSTYSKPINY